MPAGLPFHAAPDSHVRREPALRLPPNYRYAGTGGDAPSYFATTIETVKEKMANNGRARHHSKTRYFYCIYCQFDSALRGFHVDRQWHPEHLIRVDHIFPFSAVIQHVNTCYTEADYQRMVDDGFLPQTEPGCHAGWNMNDAMQREILYNDVDNLHVICSGHMQDKRDQINYLGLMPRQIQQMYPAP